ncbi:MAG TPA: pitrilysin family protein, partial [Planctomycetota bacterium]|nr:pitrilysin family protein [Planctomycetota bacterium]
RHDLPNGLTVYLMEDHELPLISLVTLVRTGSVYETRDKAGLAAIVGEVMRSGGAGERTGDDIDRTLEDMASSVEVGVSTTEARASMSCLKENFDKTLGVLLDVLDRPRFDAKKLDLAKKQAKSGIARRNDDPAGIARREFSRVMYGDDSPYGWTSENATIDGITRDDLVAFHKEYFGRPASTIVGIGGDFDAKEMLAKIEKTFGAWQPVDGVIAMPPVGLAVGEGPAPKVFFVRKPDVNQATVVLGHMGERRRPDDPDYAPLIVLNDVLGGGGFASRLLQHVRTDMGLAYGVGSRWNAPYSYRGTFSMMGQTKSASTLAMIRAMRSELATICSKPVSEDELKVAKDAIAQEMIFENDSRAKVLERAIRYCYYNFPQDYLERFQDAVSKVTAEDCLRVAKKYLHPDKLVTFVVGNDKDFDGKLSELGEVVELDVSKPAWSPKGGAAGAAGASTGAAAIPVAEALAKGKELVTKAVQAKGGLAALEGVKCYRTQASGTLQTPQGAIPVEITQLIAYPDKARMDMMAMGMAITRAVDGDKAWVKNPQQTAQLPASQAATLR